MTTQQRLTEKLLYLPIWLSIIMGVIFIAQNLYPQLTENYKLDSKLVYQKPWTIITSIFLHGGIMHLFLNLFALVLFGLILENIIGSKHFMIIFLISGLISGITSTFFYDAVLGASGAIFGIIGMLAVLRPKMVVWVSYIPMPMAIAAMVYAIGDFFGFLYASEIAYAAHIGGLICGIILSLTYYRKYRKNDQKETEINIPKHKIEQWEEKYMLKRK